MLDPKKRDGLNRGDAQFLEINSDDKEEWFSYSTGLFMSFEHPEIIVCGLDSDVGMGIINEIGAATKAGKSCAPGQDYTDIFADDHRCCFREVHPSQAKQYACYSDWFYERESFPLLQCFWADDQGNYPWQPLCNSGVINLQPLLYLPVSNLRELKN